MKKRNSMVELYRFIFAFTVLKFHGFVPLQTPYFTTGRLAVEFFFILSGFLLIKSFNKFNDVKIHKSIFQFTWSKVYPIIISLSIGIIFNIIEMFKYNDFSFNVWGYLWYVKQLLIVSLIYFVIKYFIKNEKIFFVVVVAIFLVSTIMNCNEMYYEVGRVRAFAGMSLGILLSYIPKINEKYIKNIWFVLILVQMATLCLLLFSNNLWLSNYFILERVAHWFLFPMLIYFSFQINYHNKIFDYLGSISFGLYAFQCVASCLKVYGVNNVYILFCMIILLSVVESIVKKYALNKKR